MGRSTQTLVLAGVAGRVLQACAHTQSPDEPSRRAKAIGGQFESVSPSSQDELMLAKGLSYSLLISYGDSMGRGQAFGYNNDYLGVIPITTDQAWLWVNHEYPDPLFINGAQHTRGQKRSKAEVDREMAAVGGSLLRVKKNPVSRQWEVDQKSHHHRRYTANTPIGFSRGLKILGSSKAIGTFGNCGGGITPWKTFLTCEENYDEMFGERDFSSPGRSAVNYKSARFGWESHYTPPPEHYGWVVEIEPDSGNAVKLVSLGRFAHESATVALSKQGLPVVYMGDDENDRCLYKFISDQPRSLESGTLYVADLKDGRWIPLDLKTNSLLRGATPPFVDQVDVLVRTREAAILVGATALDRPEDIKIDPISGAVFVALTNNKPKNNLYGSILKIEERDLDHGALEFTHSTFLTGGESLACPDNLLFDKNGGLWICTDMSSSVMGKGPYQKFANNGLFYIPMSGADAGNVFQIASAPVGAELTGLCFAPGGQSLFMSVQHPGEGTTHLDSPISHWPLGGANMPVPAVVEIRGPLLDKLGFR